MDAEDTDGVGGGKPGDCRKRGLDLAKRGLLLLLWSVPLVPGVVAWKKGCEEDEEDDGVEAATEEEAPGPAERLESAAPFMLLLPLLPPMLGDDEFKAVALVAPEKPF